MFKKLFLLDFLPASPDAGKLLLRIGILLPLFMKHGIEKVTNFSTMSQTFSDPIGIGVYPTFLIAWFSDVVCSVLVMCGLATRWAALYIFFNVLVAWTIKGNFWFWAKTASHGELQVVYLCALIAILAFGPGKYSIDNWLEKRLPS